MLNREVELLSLKEQRRRPTPRPTPHSSWCENTGKRWNRRKTLLPRPHAPVSLAGRVPSTEPCPLALLPFPTSPPFVCEGTCPLCSSPSKLGLPESVFNEHRRASRSQLKEARLAESSASAAVSADLAFSPPLSAGGQYRREPGT